MAVKYSRTCQLITILKSKEKPKLSGNCNVGDKEESNEPDFEQLGEISHVPITTNHVF